MLLELLDTPRLCLEPQSVAHAARLFDHFQDLDLHRWTNKSAPAALDQFKRSCASLESRYSPDGSEYWFNWVSIHRDTGDIVGKVELSILRATDSANLAYYTFRDFQRQGFAREACQAVIAHGFAKWNVSVVVIEMAARNVPSVRLAKALGAQRVSLTPNAEFFKGEWHDEYRYELRRTPELPR